MGEFVVGVALFAMGILVGKHSRSVAMLLPPDHFCQCQFCVDWRNAIRAMRDTGKIVKVQKL